MRRFSLLYYGIIAGYVLLFMKDCLNSIDTIILLNSIYFLILYIDYEQGWHQKYLGPSHTAIGLGPPLLACKVIEWEGVRRVIGRGVSTVPPDGGPAYEDAIGRKVLIYNTILVHAVVHNQYLALLKDWS